MLKKLRIKFVCINMIIVTTMLCVVFGLVIHFTGESLKNESVQMLQTIADTSGRPGPAAERQEEIRLPYFSVSIGRRGDIVVTSDGYYDLSDEDLLLEIVNAAAATDDVVGMLEEYDLRYCKRTTPIGLSIVFADTSSEQATIDSLIKNCILIGILSFGIFLGLSFFLAHWAIQPVEKAWQQQRQFVADASHELKTPLTVIMTNAELLQSGQYAEEDRLRFSDSILTMSHQMRGLVESLLELARVDNGAVKTAFAHVDLSQIISDGILPFEPLYFEKDLQLYTQIEEHIHVKGSAPHLGQVLEILLDNAMKYSYPTGQVWVTLKKQGSHALLTVVNPGPAIEHEDLKNIFKRFYRVDKARSRDGSYGLGLSIAESIVTEHSGRIWAESANGINSFFVQLPTP